MCTVADIVEKLDVDRIIDEAIQDLKAMGTIPAFDRTSFDSDEIQNLCAGTLSQSEVDTIRRDLAIEFNHRLLEEAKKQGLRVVHVGDQFQLELPQK